MKIKELPPESGLGGLKVKTPEGKVGYWSSQWQKGVWLLKEPTKGGQIFPIFVKDLQEVLEWEVNVPDSVNL